MSQLRNGDVILKKALFNKPYFVSVGALSLLASIIRFIELATNIEAKTGFYKNEVSFFRIVFIIVLVITALFGIFWRRFAKKNALLPMNMKFDFSSLFSERILLAAVAVGFAVNTFYEIFRLKNPLDSILQPQSITSFSVITTIFSALCLAYFIILSFLMENKRLATSFLSVITVAWIAFRILRDFIAFTTLISISKNLLDILYLCALTVTMFSVCRLFSNSDIKKGYTQFTLLAPITIVLAFVLSVPPIFGFIFGLDTVGESDVFMHFIDLLLALFLTRISMHIYREA